jgi:hypothetical protein
MAEPEAGMVTVEQARLLLLFDGVADLKRLEKEGAFAQATPGNYWIKDLVQGFVRHMRANRYTTTTPALAQCFGLSLERIRQLAREGWFKALAPGKYDFIEAAGGYIKFLRDQDRRSSKSSADTRIKDAKAKDIEVRTAQRLGRLVPLETFEEMIDTIAGMVRTEFAGLATVVTRDLILRRIIEREVNARLRRIAEQAMAEAIRLEASSRADDAVRADRAGRVGGGEQDVPTDSGSTGAA